MVLADEYDAPLLNVTHDDGKLQEFREVMRGFYAPLKACDEWLRFVFLTGITKFSELNNLQNISMNPHYAAICGISEQELLEEMGACLDEFAFKLGVGRDAALAQLKEHYDGYHFTADSPDIYNPFSLISALANGRIESYWFGSGTPTFLISLLQRHHWDIASVDGCTARETSFDAPAERLDTPLPMLYQAGYLTTKGYDPRRRAYTLGVPNREVRHGLSESLVQHAAPVRCNRRDDLGRMKRRGAVRRKNPSFQGRFSRSSGSEMTENEDSFERSLERSCEHWLAPRYARLASCVASPTPPSLSAARSLAWRRMICRSWSWAARRGRPPCAGTCRAAVLCLTYCCSSRVSASLGSKPSRSVSTAHTTWPRMGSGAPTMALSRTAGWVLSTLSISNGPMR